MVMKFGQHCDVAFPRLCLDLPPFPYKEAKKILKLLSHSSKENRGPSQRDSFVAYLDGEMRRIDSKWHGKAHNIVKAAKSTIRLPRTTAVLIKFGLRKRSRPEEAERLDAWAQLSRDGMRKIIKKYNKQLGACCGHVLHLPSEPFNFVNSRTRTELESLVLLLASHSALLTPTITAGEACRSCDAASAPPVQECPVCLDTLYEPVAPACGHAMCHTCFESLRANSVVPQCPMCRRPARWAQRMPVIGAAAKAADPAGWHAACDRALQKKEDALAAEYARRGRHHPMAMLVQ